MPLVLLKKINLFLSFILIFLLHIPFVFAKSVSIAKFLNEKEEKKTYKNFYFAVDSDDIQSGARDAVELK